MFKIVLVATFCLLLNQGQFVQIIISMSPFYIKKYQFLLTTNAVWERDTMSIITAPRPAPQKRCVLKAFTSQTSKSKMVVVGGMQATDPPIQFLSPLDNIFFSKKEAYAFCEDKHIGSFDEDLVERNGDCTGIIADGTDGCIETTHQGRPITLCCCIGNKYGNFFSNKLFINKAKKLSSCRVGMEGAREGGWEKGGGEEEIGCGGGLRELEGRAAGR